MGGPTDNYALTLTGLCPAAVSKLSILGYIENAMMPGDGRPILGVCVLTERGRKALGGLIEAIPMPEIKEP